MGYSENRRATAVPALKAVSRNEATEGTDDRRQTQWERAREAVADDLKRAAEGPKRSFAERLQPTKK